MPVLIAVCTNLVRGLAVCHRRLYRVDQETAPDFLKFVALLLCFPVFEAHQFFFKITYTLQQKRMMRLGFHDLAGEIYDKRLSSRSVSDLKELLSEVEQRGKTLITRI